MRSFLIVVSLAAAAASLQAADAAAGKAAYDKSCKSCHGPDGTPSAGMAKAMNLKDLKSPDVQAASDGDLQKIITDGKGKMKPVPAAAAAAPDIVAYMRSIKK
ncbi:MAG TPA: c-type cytochrome [Bryobacteraceae bacterium]|jgi:mono/diheme cytochrome c family protein|nr:c-type cytochrome [Bryobacteraceae bacterium]